MTQAERAIEKIHAACLHWATGRIETTEAVARTIEALENYGMPVIGAVAVTANDDDDPGR